MKPIVYSILTIAFTVAIRAGEIVAVAHPEENLTFSETVVWTPLFQAAWDRLHHDLGVPVKVEPPSVLMDCLDHFQWRVADVMPRDHWKVWAGNATEGFIEKANNEAAKITGEHKAVFEIKPRPEARIALGLLDRDLVFKRPLHRSVDAPLVFHATNGTTSQVRFFGSRRKASGGYGGVVRVLAYQTESHALEIASDGDDSAVFYLPAKPTKFAEACAKLRAWRVHGPQGSIGSEQDPQLHEKDDVRIPMLKLENTTDFGSLLSSDRYFGKAGDPWQLYKAEQRLRFCLTEKGAKLRAEAEAEMNAFGEPPPPPPMIPRSFHYDRPFFVFLWRNAADWPYFGAWIGNDAAMEKFQEAQ